jgi:hypothetical protein
MTGRWKNKKNRHAPSAAHRPLAVAMGGISCVPSQSPEERKQKRHSTNRLTDARLNFPSVAPISSKKKKAHSWIMNRTIITPEIFYK